MRLKNALKYVIPIFIGLSSYSCAQKAAEQPAQEIKEATPQNEMDKLARASGSVGQPDSNAALYFTGVINKAREKGVPLDTLEVYLKELKEKMPDKISKRQTYDALDAIGLINEGVRVEEAIDYTLALQHTQPFFGIRGDLPSADYIASLKKNGITPQRVMSLKWFHELQLPLLTEEQKIMLEGIINRLNSTGTFPRTKLRYYGSLGAFSEVNNFRDNTDDQVRTMFTREVQKLIYLEGMIGEKATKGFFQLNREGANLSPYEVGDFVDKGISYSEVKRQLQEKRREAAAEERREKEEERRETIRSAIK